VALAETEVLLVGLFSAKQKDHAAVMDELAELVGALGARVMGCFVQRRGVSDGGATKMSRPYSSRTLVSAGKVREIAAAREKHGAGAVVFVNPLTAHQREVLTESLGCVVISRTDLQA
jgi:50S ribosomal subunit-associated GTPase HflX